ncbi:hypothetical protein B0J11DRAFT_449538 [Dendryphion nanum]|uniref:Uncharacterized protein n=1 Tax=Dendryphion nanum TaxID=256645 RepID=A0A9P9I5N5_9PLEO|nr:hypothetical protein B0J11DRAFT_449538 [Dendryphion nanum]
MWARSLSVVASCILGVLTCLLVATFILRRDTPKEISDKFHTWIQYKTEGSSGPKYQLAINGKNASQWNAYVNDDTRQWALRVDDQAIIPLELMDEEEKHYQEWFHKRYPEVRKITLDRDYLNETWLNSPSRDLVPVDEMFHFSHCVLALRRYVKAKRTGRHVCGRDLDEEHMNHCLDSFDWWAFREGERGDSLENPKQPLWWRTKVCFD